MKYDGQMGVYIHWPFCLAKCPYCDFNSHVRDGIDEVAWCAAYLKALDYYAEHVDSRMIRSVFFGGGTPSLMNPNTVEAILERIHKNWRIVNDIEVTLEANPTSVESQKFKDFRAAGINRVSIGVQSLNDKDLKFLGRKHSAAEALQAIETARSTFDRYSFDLMYARPDQTLPDWEAELTQALKYAGGHLSLYQLTIERSTPFYMSHARGDFVMPQQDLAADFYLLTQKIMQGAGLPAYEVSNHARAGQESRHNLIYWHYDDYIGVGPGAHGRPMIGGQKYAIREHAAPEIWLARAGAQGNAIKNYEVISAQERFNEALMMGLRLVQGVSKQTLQEQVKKDIFEILDGNKIQKLKAQGWLQESDTHIILNTEGMLRLNAIIPFVLQ